MTLIDVAKLITDSELDGDKPTMEWLAKELIKTVRDCPEQQEGVVMLAAVIAMAGARIENHLCDLRVALERISDA